MESHLGDDSDEGSVGVVDSVIDDLDHLLLVVDNRAIAALEINNPVLANERNGMGPRLEVGDSVALGSI